MKAYIVLKPGEIVKAEEIIAHCRERLAPDKVPQNIEFIDALPKSAMGKILRREIRRSGGNRVWQALGRRVSMPREHRDLIPLEGMKNP